MNAVAPDINKFTAQDFGLMVATDPDFASEQTTIAFTNETLDAFIGILNTNDIRSYWPDGIEFGLTFNLRFFADGLHQIGAVFEVHQHLIEQEPGDDSDGFA